MEALRRYVISAGKLRANDTPVPVLAPGKGKTKSGRLWTYIRDDPPADDTAAPAVWFVYSPDGKGEHPEQHLKKFRGTLQTDAYAGFNQLYQDGRIEQAASRRMCGATSTIWNRRSVRWLRVRPWRESGHCTASRNRFAADHPANAVPCARQK